MCSGHFDQIWFDPQFKVNGRILKTDYISPLSILPFHTLFVKLSSLNQTHAQKQKNLIVSSK